jgi:hypothetical protein
MSPQAHFISRRMLIPALVAALLLTPAVSAQARVTDPSGAAATPTRVLAGPPTWPAHPQPINAVPAADDSSSVNWATIGLGLAGSLLAVSGIVALTGRRSRRLRRLSVTP